MDKPIVLNITEHFVKHKIIGQLHIWDDDFKEVLEDFVIDNKKAYKKGKDTDYKIVIRPSAYMTKDGKKVDKLVDVGLFIE